MDRVSQSITRSVIVSQDMVRVNELEEQLHLVQMHRIAKLEKELEAVKGGILKSSNKTDMV